MSSHSFRLAARPPQRRRPHPPFALGAVCLAVACLPAMAQDTTTSRRLSIEPTFDATAAFSHADGSGSFGELVTQLSPGVRVSSRSGRVQGSLNYALQGTVYSRRTGANQINQTLNASGRAEAVPGWAFVDARANIGKVSLSPYGELTAPGSISTNDNQRDVLTFAISPYLRGDVKGVLDYEVRLSGSATDVRKSSFGDSNTAAASVTLASARRPGMLLGWGLQASQDRVTFKGGRATDNARVTASLSITPDPDLSLALRAGQESTNVTALDKQTYDNWGAGVRWTPTPRTLIDLSVDRRYYGNSYRVTLEHRLRSSALRFTSTRAATSGADPYGVGQPTTLFDLMMRATQSRVPDAVEREAYVRNLLLANSLSPDAVVGGGFATAAISLQRREDLTYTYTGQLSTLAVQAFVSSTEVIDNASAQRGLGRTEQVGLLGTVSHRLTPRMAGNLQLGYQENRGTQQGQGKSHLTSLSVGVTQRLNLKSTATAGVRHSISGGASTSNRETALTASLSMRF